MNFPHFRTKSNACMYAVKFEQLEYFPIWIISHKGNGKFVEIIFLILV